MDRQRLSLAPLPDSYEFLVAFVESPALTEAEPVRGQYPAFGPVGVAELMRATLGESIRHSPSVEDRELANRRTRGSWGFFRLAPCGRWSLVGDSYLVSSMAFHRLGELLADPFVTDSLSSNLRGRIERTRSTSLQQRKGSAVTALIELKQICAVIPDSERLAWLGEFLGDHFDGLTRASAVSRALKDAGYPYALDGKEVRELIADHLQRDSRHPLPVVDGYECYPFGEPLADLLRTWADNAPRT